jgi:hypothetical protein
MTNPITILVVAYNRPLHLWAALDSLYRNTKHPHRFVLLHMPFGDPTVPSVIDGFERRGMFAEIIRAPQNDPQLIWQTIWSLLPGSGELFSYVETDVVVEDTEPCWLGTMAGLMARNRKLAMVGSVIDKRDFVDLERGRALAPGYGEKQIMGLIKAGSVERRQEVVGPDGPELIRPHNPPGRLLLLRSSALATIGSGTDQMLDQKFQEAGYETGIATRVRHRHLSLLNIFDYPENDVFARNDFMMKIRQQALK